MHHIRLPHLASCLLLGLSVLSCRLVQEPPPAGEPPASGPAAPGESTPAEPAPVKKVEEEIVVAAWAEPARLPPSGGQAQLLVRVQKRGGARFPGVEVSFGASAGRLYSRGGILVTNRQGMTRDRITTTKTTVITLNAGGTRYRFKVPVGDDAK
jgi:hypothetical protein